MMNPNHDERLHHHYMGDRYYNGPAVVGGVNGASIDVRHGADPYSQPPMSHSHIQYGRSPREMDIAKTFDHEPFRHTDPKYKCLCNKMHVKQGCKFILGFLIAVAVITALLMILNWNVGTWTTFWIHLIILLGMIACAAALFMAMKTEKEQLLLPATGLAILGAIISIIFIVFFLWTLIDPHGPTGKLVNNFVVSDNNMETTDFGLTKNRDAILGISSIMLVLSLLGLAACIWVAFVVYKYFMYLKDMKFARVPKNQVHIKINDINKGMHQ